MMEFSKVEEFNYKGKKCVIVRCSGFGQGPYHNGYIQTKNNTQLDYDDFNSEIESDELTFNGELKRFNVPGWFLGFDSAHVWNTPLTSSHHSVKERTIQIADEMIKLGI